MDYKEKYEAALLRAKEFMSKRGVKPDEDAFKCAKELSETIFPELCKSEDERIRKELIEHIKANKEADYVLFKRFSPDDVIAWLEKQGEQKSAWSEEDEIGLGNTMWAIEQVRSLAKDENDMGNLWYAERWIKSIKKRMKGE